MGNRARKMQREALRRRQGATVHQLPDRGSVMLRGDAFSPLEDRREYRANMQAWREAGCPGQSEFPSIQ